MPLETTVTAEPEPELLTGWKYEPLPTQRRFHADIDALYKGYSGPIGCGKSYSLIYEMLFYAAMNPGLPGLIGAPTYPMLRDATLRTMWDVLAEEEIPYEFLKTENLLILPEAPFYGANVLCRSLDAYERLRGTNLAWFGIDELTYAPQEAWTRLQGRLRHPKANRRGAFAAWTPKGYDWVYEAFINNPKPGWRAYIASPRENRYVTETGMYDALQAGYDEKLYRQEVLGEYLSLTSGLAYYSFDRRMNVRDLPYDRRLPLCWSLDFNINPMCSVIAQVEEITDAKTVALTGHHEYEIRILDEIYLGDSNTPEACEAFEEHTQQYQRGNPLVVYVYGDASGSARQRAVGAGANSDWAVIKQYFANKREYKMSYKYKPANPLVKDRVAAVNAGLCNSQQVRRVFVHPRCKMLIRDFERVTFKAGTNTLDQTTDPMLTHISDAAGYLIETVMGFRQTGGPRQTWIA